LDDFKTNTKYFFLFFIGFFISGFSQEKKDKALLEAYVNFFEAPREQIYVHLNKTTFLEGEPLGFSAYVLDAYKKPSLTATNLYCTITDTTNAIIKKKISDGPERTFT
jgi:cbb3-type cytochrome oxidase subunit 3